MNITSLNHKRICILGYGREGQTTYAALQHFAPEATVAVADSNPKVPVESGCQLISGPKYLEQLTDFDVIIKSPGIPWRPTGNIAAKVTSATELFFNSLPKGALTIGITGTKGKSSTAYMMYKVLKAAGREVILAGNIGDSMLSFLETATETSIFILELSSYQLESLHTSPHIAILTSFFPDHLDYHGDLKHYWAAKANIAKYQTASDMVFYNASYPQCRQMALLSPGRQEPFTAGDFAKTMSFDAMDSNRAAVLKVATELGLGEAAVRATLATIAGLPHRQQPLGLHAGIEWVDDSAATTPQSTIAALDVLGDKVDTLIVGGLNRDYNFSELGQKIASSAITHVILYPETGELVQSAIKAAKPKHPITYLKTASMKEAVTWASDHTTPGKICLLSSGAPSYNLFKDFGERGDAFTSAIAALKNP